MENLDYNRIISYEYLSDLSEEDRNKLITIANIESSKLSANSIDNIIATQDKHLKVKEILNTGLYKTFPIHHKEIIATYIMYDNEQIINTLLDIKMSYKMIKNLAIKISEFRFIYKLKPNDNIFNSDYFSNIMSIINKICFYIKNKFKIQDEYLIINKIMCLAAFEKELYLKLEQQKSI